MEAYKQNITTSFVISLGLHLVILSIFQIKSQPINKDDNLITLKLITEIPKISTKEEQQQIVSTEQEKISPPPKETKLKSEIDNTVKKEMIKRGDPLAVKPSSASKKNLSKQETKEEQKNSNPQKEAKLFDNNIISTLNNNLSNDKSNDTQREKKFLKAEPFSKNSLANLYAKFGSADHLPEIPDGDMTLLNTKADQYAVFVRRVGLQVFSAIRKLSWQELARSEISQINDFSEVEAILSANGDFEEIKIRTKSGSSSFDQLLKQASKQGAWDQNPPKGALAADGKIHFLFKSKTWARFNPSGVGEQRWILLGVGLL